MASLSPSPSRQILKKPTLLLSHSKSQSFDLLKTPQSKVALSARPYKIMANSSRSRIKISALPTEYSSRYMTAVQSQIDVLGEFEASQFKLHTSHSFEILDAVQPPDKTVFSATPIQVSEGKMMPFKGAAGVLQRFQIDSLGKHLPCMFQVDGAPPETTILLSFGRWPTPQKHDISTSGHRMYIGPEWEHALVERYAMKICVIPKHLLRSQAWTAFTKQSVKVEAPPPSTKRNRLLDYSQYLDIKLHPAPPRPRPSPWKKSFLLSNIESQRFESKQKHLFDIKSRTDSLAEKIHGALSKKEENIQDKKSQLISQLDRKEKERQQKQVLLEKVATRAQKVAQVKGWILNLSHCRVLLDLKGMLMTRKTALILQKMKARKAQLIQDVWKMCVAKRDEEVKELQELQRIRLILGIATGTVRKRVREQSAQVCGVFFQALHFCIRLNNKCFEYSSQFTVLQNKMKRHMRVRHELYKKFVLELDKCGKEAMIYDKTRGDSYLADNLFKITEQQKRAVFDYLFNHSLIGNLQSKLKKLHSEEEDAQYQDSPLASVKGFPGIKRYLSNHELAGIFSKVDKDFKAGVFEAYTDMRTQGSKLSFASRSSASLARQETKRFEKKAQDQHKAALLRMIENKDLKKVFQTFIGPMDSEALSLSYPRSYYVGIHLKLLEATYPRDYVNTPATHTRKNRQTTNSMKEVSVGDAQSPKSLANI